jgi:hypothetical protein
MLNVPGSVPFSRKIRNCSLLSTVRHSLSGLVLSLAILRLVSRFVVMGDLILLLRVQLDLLI